MNREDYKSEEDQRECSPFSSTLHDHIRLVSMSANFAERALTNSSGVSRDVWVNWVSHRRAVDDLVALYWIRR